MRIIEDRCNGCGQCEIICTVRAIHLIDKKAVIDRDQCVECYICYRESPCPNKAIKPERLKWPRIVRNPFSSVIATHELTGVPGRGTEEMKTNDVTGRYDFGEIGFSIELGRPGIGTYFRNIELFTIKLSSIGVEYEKENPVTALIVDNEGHVNQDLKNEHVLSAIIEFKVPEKKLNQVLEIIREIDKEIDTVFSVGIVTRVNGNGSIPLINVLEEEGFNVRPNAKINIGLGKA